MLILQAQEQHADIIWNQYTTVETQWQPENVDEFGKESRNKSGFLCEHLVSLHILVGAAKCG